MTLLQIIQKYQDEAQESEDDYYKNEFQQGKAFGLRSILYDLEKYIDSL